MSQGPPRRVTSDDGLEAARTPLGRGARITVVDDSPSARQLIAANLALHGFEVSQAADADTALLAARARPPHAIVTDLWMPGVSGVQLCRLLRAERATSSMPIVFLTASDDRRSAFWAKCAGASGYVSKSDALTLPHLLADLIGEEIISTPAASLVRSPLPIQEALSALLDRSLFDATFRNELRLLAYADGDYDALFESLVSAVSQVMAYRWFALEVVGVDDIHLHVHPDVHEQAVPELRGVLALADDVIVRPVIDGRPVPQRRNSDPAARVITNAGMVVGRFALGPAGSGSSNDELHLLDLVASELGGALRMNALVAATRRLAMADPLTSLMNRRAFLEAVGREESRALRHTLALSVLVIDVDLFKRVNDTYGHDGGDEVLKVVASILRKSSRASDIVARWGGEEFVVALPHTAAAGARVAAERIRRSVAAAIFTLPGHDAFSVTVSVGAASAPEGAPFAELMRRADAALYLAKNRGRNLVEVA